MIRKISLNVSRARLISVLPAFLVWPPGLFAWTQPAVAFSGQATVLRVTTHGIIDITNTVSDTGPLSPSGGALQTSLLSVNFPGLPTADVAQATSAGNTVGSFEIDGNLTVAHLVPPTEPIDWY